MFIIIKVFLAVCIVLCSLKIGILISKKYKYRLEELDELKNELKIIENKIKYTYQPLEEIFCEMIEISSFQIKSLYEYMTNNIKKVGAEKAWKEAVFRADLNLNNEDKNVLKQFGTLLGKTNKEGQLNQINFTAELIDRQIDNAIKERNKNEKMYQKLGLIFGIGIVIVLI